MEKYEKFDKLIYPIVIIILGVLGYLNFEQNRIWKNSETFWSHVLDYHPGYINAWEKRAEYYTNKAQYHKAQSDIEKYLSLNPNNSDMWSNLGLVSMFNKQYENSLKAFNRAIHMNPNKLGYYNNRSMVYYAMGDTQKARRDLNFLKSKGFKGLNTNYETLINQEK